MKWMFSLVVSGHGVTAITYYYNTIIDLWVVQMYEKRKESVIEATNIETGENITLTSMSEIRKNRRLFSQ